MLCPNCHAECQDGSHFCCFCGVHLPEDPPEVEPAPLPPEEASIPVEEVPSAPEEAPDTPGDRELCPLPESAPPRRGTLWAPLLALLGMFTLGLLLFLFTAGRGQAAASTEVPWFRVDDSGAVRFVEKAYFGNGEVTIPNTLNGQSVQALDENCFAGSGITTAILPGTVRAIGANAFANCDALRGIFLPDGVTTIGSGAFSGCGALEAICIPDSVRQIGDGAFSGCEGLRFIFYSGSFEDWCALYGDFISPYTYVICMDGVYLHPSRMP